MPDSFQWERCDAAGANCVDIAGATAASYLIVPADVGATLRARGSRDGSLVGESAATAVVTAEPPPPDPGDAIPFMYFDGGIDDAGVQSWPLPGHVARHANGGPNNQPWGRFTADQSTIQASDPGHIRVHEWGRVDGGLVPEIQPGLVSWRPLALRVPSGFTAASTALFAGDEVHQSSDYGRTGPAPANGPTHDGIGGRWYHVARGANHRGLAGSAFSQTVFGRASTSNGTLVPFTGGPRLVVPNRWTSNFPMASLYTDVSPGTRALDYALGFYLDDFDTAKDLIDGLAGFA
jgi:hypothetical protein